MKSLIRNTIAWLLSAFYLSGSKIRDLKESSSKGDILLSVYFHNPSKKLFTSCVSWLKKKGFQFISVEDMQKIIYEKKSLPTNAVLITVDDGWKENKDNIAAVAEQMKIPVTIFISTDPVEKEKRFWWSTIEEGLKRKITTRKVGELKQISNRERATIVKNIEKELPEFRDALTVTELIEISESDYVSIGSHTVTHPILTQCEDQQVSSEISDSKQKLESWIKKPVTSFAYPNGMYGEREKQILKNSGYNIAFNTIPDYITKESLRNPFDLPRFDVLENVTLFENYCRMTGIWFLRKNKKTI